MSDRVGVGGAVGSITVGLPLLPHWVQPGATSTKVRSRCDCRLDTRTVDIADGSPTRWGPARRGGRRQTVGRRLRDCRGSCADRDRRHRHCPRHLSHTGACTEQVRYLGRRRYGDLCPGRVRSRPLGHGADAHSVAGYAVAVRLLWMDSWIEHARRSSGPICDRRRDGVEGQHRAHQRLYRHRGLVAHGQHRASIATARKLVRFSPKPVVLVGHPITLSFLRTAAIRRAQEPSSR